MRQGVLRSELRKEVQIEAGLSTLPGHDTQNAERINHYLNKAQRELEAKYKWPLMGTYVDVVVTPDTRYVDFDPSITFEKVRQIEVAYGSIWPVLTYGINEGDRSIYNTSMRSTPPRKWQVDAAQPGKFEIWPISAKEETLRIQGELSIPDMTTDSDACTLDGDAIVYQAAGFILAKTKPDLAALALRAAQDRVASVMERNVSRKIPDGYMGRQYRRIGREGIDFISPGRTSS